jgi:hypothetical protein
MPLNAEGEPEPWFTFAAVKQLEKIVRPTHSVFEYGSGDSTIWWARRVGRVVSVEHNAYYFAAVVGRLPENVECHRVPRTTKGAAEVEIDDMTKRFLADGQFPTFGDRRDIEHGLVSEGFYSYAMTPMGRKFDIVVIDGMARSLCAFLAPRYLNDDGIVIFDNSDRWHYNEGFKALAERGFKRLDYRGPGLVNDFEWCTSIFCRNLNWLPDETSIPVGSPSDISPSPA